MNAAESAGMVARLRKEAREHIQLAKEAKEAADRIERDCPESSEFVKAIPINTKRELILFRGDAGTANGPYFRCGVEEQHYEVRGEKRVQRSIVVMCPTFLRNYLTIGVDGPVNGAGY